MAITHVGTATPASVIDGGTVTIDLTTIAGLAQDDIVIFVAAGTGGTPATPGTWNNISLGSGVATISMGYKLMGASPDTSITFWDTGGSTDSGCAVAMAFRGVDTTTPLDGVTPTTSFLNSVPQAPAITPQTNNAAIVIGCATEALDASVGSVTDYPTQSTTTSNDNSDTTAAIAFRILTGGAGTPETPAAWSTWASTNFRSATCVLRASGESPPVSQGNFTGSGAGTLAATAQLVMAAAAIFEGAGSASIIAFVDAQAQALLAGAGSLTIDAFVSGRINADARFDGAGSLSATALLVLPAAASFAGDSSLTVNAVRAAFASAALEVSATVAANGAPVGAAHLNATATVAAVATSGYEQMVADSGEQLVFAVEINLWPRSDRTAA